MCINNSVGKNGVNLANDVKTVQILINLNIGASFPIKALSVDGRVGPATISAIEGFQRQVLKIAQADGLIEPQKATLNKLRASLPTGLSPAKLQGIFINASAASISMFALPLAQQMSQNGINTPLRMAHFLAQIGHESNELMYTEEIASGAAYENRVDLGNTQPGDGIRFKGRGLLQLTGRANYAKYSKGKSVDYTVEPNNKLIATDPTLAVDVAIWFWNKHVLNKLADADNILAITKVINGGTNGQSDRQAKLARAKFFLS